MEQCSENLYELTSNKIAFGEKLLNCLTDFANLDGISKVHRKIKQEITFLKKIKTSRLIKKEHLQCSNLTHFDALISTLNKVDKIVAVNKVFSCNDLKVVIDIVYDNGLKWMKVVARNPKAIKQICLGNSGFGVRSVLDQANDYLNCAQMYPCLFQIPKITFYFANGIYEDLAQHLESMGINVEGEKLVDDADNIEIAPYKEEINSVDISGIKKVNLDVSTMLAYISSVTNGSCMKYKLHTKVLAQQAAWEEKRPVKPILDTFFEGKTLYCCETAKHSLLEIVNTVGGPNEQVRAEELLKRITVLPDDATVADTSEKSSSEVFKNVQLMPNKALYVGGKIRERSLKIFTFGDRIQAVTVTANDGFVRAAKQQGVNFVVLVHESRALTEQKEMKAELVQ